MQTLIVRMTALVVIGTLPAIVFMSNSANCQTGSGKTNSPSSLVNPFNQLLHEVQLPDPPADNQGSSSATVRLGNLDPTIQSTCKLIVHSDLADLEGIYEFVCRQDPTQKVGDWNLFIQRSAHAVGGNTPTIGSGRLFTEPLSQVFLRKDELHFSWNVANLSRYNSQLANSTLEFVSGQHRHILRLRPLEVRSAIVLDLEKPQSRIPLKLKNLPNREYIACVVNGVEYSGSEDFVPQFQIMPKSRQVGIGGQIFLNRADAVATEVSIELIERKAGPELVIRTAYSPAKNRRRPFAAKKLRDDYLRTVRTLKEGHSKHAQAKDAVPELERNLREVQNRRTRNAEEEAERTAEVTRAKAELQRALSTIRRFERSLPKLEASLASLKDTADVGELLHKQLQFHLVIKAARGKDAIDLIRFGDETISRGSAIASIP